MENPYAICYKTLGDILAKMKCQWTYPRERCVKSNNNAIGEDTESEINSYKFIFKTVTLQCFIFHVV